MGTLDHVPPPKTVAEFNAILDILNGFSASGSFIPPVTFTIYHDGTDVHALNGYQTVYGGASDAGGADGGDPDAVINAALGAIDGYGGGAIHFREGTYTIDAQLDIPSNLRMTADHGTIITLANGADCFILRASGADEGTPTKTENVYISGFTFDGNGGNQTANGWLSLTAIQHWTFIHNTIQDVYSNAIYVQPIGDPETPTHGCDYNFFANNKIVTANNNADMFIMGMRYSTVMGNYLSGTTGSYMLSCGSHSQGLRIIGNTLRSGGLTGIGAESSRRLWIEKNDISGMAAGHGIYVKDVALYDAPTNIVIKDNMVTLCETGIYITDNCNRVDIVGNHVFNNGDAGITTYNCQNWKMIGNTIYDNDQDGNAAPNNCGIRIGHASDTGIIKDNIIYDGGGATQDYGIYFGAHAAVVLGANRISGNVTAAVGNISSSSVFTSEHVTRSATSLDLSGGAATVPVFHANTACILLKLNLLYTEATAAENVTLEVGKETDRDYYYTGTSEQSKAQWYEHPIDQLKTDIAAGDTVTFYTLGDGAGTGEIMLVMEYMPAAED